MGIAAIEEMVASQTGVDWVMVELTGVADPGQSNCRLRRKS
jgi:G3E family GTPase